MDEALIRQLKQKVEEELRQRESALLEFWLQELKGEGLIRYLGLTNFDAAHLSVALHSGSVSIGSPVVALRIPSTTRSLRIPSSSVAAFHERVIGSRSVSSRPTPAIRTGPRS